MMDKIVRFRPGKRPYFVFLLLFGIPIFLGVLVAIFKTQEAWKGVGYFILMAFCFYTWIYLHTIDIDLNRISYYSLFGGNRSLLIAEIANWSIRIGVFKYMDRFKPTVRLEIESFDPEKKSIIIAIKLFKKEDIDKVLSWLPADKEKGRGSRRRTP